MACTLASEFALRSRLPSFNDQHPSPPALVLATHHAHRTHHRKAQEALLARPQRRPRHGRQRRLCFLVGIRRVSSCTPSLTLFRYGVHLKHGKKPRWFSVVIPFRGLILFVQCKSRRSSTSSSSGPSRTNRSTPFSVLHSYNPHLTAQDTYCTLPSCACKLNARLPSLTSMIRCWY